MFKECFERIAHKKFDMLLRQCYIPGKTSI